MHDGRSSVYCQMCSNLMPPAACQTLAGVHPLVLWKVSLCALPGVHQDAAAVPSRNTGWHAPYAWPAMTMQCAVFACAFTAGDALQHCFDYKNHGSQARSDHTTGIQDALAYCWYVMWHLCDQDKACNFVCAACNIRCLLWSIACDGNMPDVCRQHQTTVAIMTS